MTTTIERRFATSAELRAATEGAVRSIVGRPALYSTRSDLIGGRFHEIIAPGAFKAPLASSDVRALFNHDENYVLGRMSAGTLALTEDQRGLAMNNTPPDTQWARDLVTSIDRGDISQMSFGFLVGKGNDSWAMGDGVAVRTIHNFAEILDVSAVTFPAYPDTAVAVRSLTEWESAQTVVAEIPATVQRDIRRRRLQLFGR